MISSCANPACHKPFHYLRSGRLYRFDSRASTAADGDVVNAVYKITPSHKSVFFWLCKECSSKVSLSFDGYCVAVFPRVQHGPLFSKAPSDPASNFDSARTNLQEAAL
jgi:hypothetical protein